ncbi:pantetheine-phosphate adenylyltransferase [Psychromonas antarctica]|jgi:pantetheine-phosphate adenylyltransferase|uniref:pantetheine-phosphate adenylyltransferase n=1 Tax=Psychromonas antarctica TaxID=67573 RepID=UPI001EE7A948|nr:pantetheine-phosphate adenylyltransferase [Psychromonas antarctica]MCG6201464.1 pantetheine-phosphate adenylyltransferase [Psychromonas antarctica]
MNTVVFPGSFDPVTNGHIDLLIRASRLAERVIVAVAVNTSKRTLFSLEERCALLEEVTAEIPGIEVIPFSGLLADFASEYKAQALIRGIRGATDADYEMQLAQVNRSLNPRLETLLLPASAGTGFISSTIVKEVFKHQGDINAFAPLCVAQALFRKQAANS